MNENIDLTKILKGCPDGEQFWSPMLGYVKLYNINQERKIVSVILETDATWDINANGTISIGNVTSPDIMLYPSKDQRDWSKFTAPWYKKDKFDPNTLKPFDKVLAKDSSTSLWRIALFYHMVKSRVFSCVCMHTNFMYCIPYNDKTKHLIGTTDEAPEYYRYWED